MSGELELAEFIGHNPGKVLFELEAEDSRSTPERILRRILKSSMQPLDEKSFYYDSNEAGLRQNSRNLMSLFPGRTIAYVARVDKQIFRVAMDADMFEEAIKNDVKLEKAYRLMHGDTLSSI
ncbi:MAG: hypothetical protein AABY10_00370 [Nanoarchaeota archaeon]